LRVLHFHDVLFQLSLLPLFVVAPQILMFDCFVREKTEV